MILGDPAAASQGRIEGLDAYWRAANYLGTAQLYLQSNPLLHWPLRAEDCKPRPVGHWGTQPGLNFIYAHLNRLICDHEAQVLLVVGPGHGAPAILANLFLEGTLADFDPDLHPNVAGITRLARQFSWPGGSASHITAQTPGAIHEGGELGYSLAHAFGAAFDNPNLIVACVIGDGEAETGPLAASWHSNKFLNAATSGAVLPILHLNGYKLSGPALLARMTNEQLTSLFFGFGYEPIIVEAEFMGSMHASMWAATEHAYQRIRDIQRKAREDADIGLPRWPMIVLRSEKGMTGPAVIDGKQNADTTRSHGLPLSDPGTNPAHLRILAEWLASYVPDELFNKDGTPTARVLECIPPRELCMGRNPHANAGQRLRALSLPDPTLYAPAVDAPGLVQAMATAVCGQYLAGVLQRNTDAENFRLFCPDETTSNKLDSVFTVTDRAFMMPTVSQDEHLSPTGRVMEILSEHTCEGWLEGYLLTGRHGIFACYEGFIPIVDSMVHQYAKWLKVSSETPWRAPVASLNYLLTSHVWRQDHNGFSHQGPGFIDSLLSNKSSMIRIYLPPDANGLLSVMEHCLQTRDYVNLIIAGKNDMPQWQSLSDAQLHCQAGASAWDWAGMHPEDPTVILAGCGDVPTLETLAAAKLLRDRVPSLKFRIVNVIDLMKLAAPQDHPHGADGGTFARLFGKSTPVVMAFHGYPRVIHQLLHHRPNAERFHVRGYEEEGTTTTPFDMVVRNRISRYHLVLEALTRSGLHSPEAEDAADFCRTQLAGHARYITQHGEDMPEIRDWRWA